jgi:hypothetical protein
VHFSLKKIIEKGIGNKVILFWATFIAGEVILLLPGVILMPPEVIQKAPRGPF